MNTFKTAVVLAALLSVGYGVHVVLNAPLNNNGSLQQNGQLPFDEFGLPGVDIQHPAQGIVGHAQGRINQAQGAVGQAFNQGVQSLNSGQPPGDDGAFQMPEIQLPEIAPHGLVDAPQGAISNYQNQLANVAQNAVGSVQNAANDVSNQANGFVSQANSLVGQAQAAVIGQAQRPFDQAQGMAGNLVGQATNVVGNVAGQARDALGQATDAANPYAANAQGHIQNGIEAVQGAASDLSLNPGDFPALPSLAAPATSTSTNHSRAVAARQQNFASASPTQTHPSAMTPVANAAAFAASPRRVQGSPPSSGAGFASAQTQRYNTLPSNAGISSAAFASMWRSAQEKVNAGMPADALFTLSLWYSNPELSTEQRDSMIPMLDELAGKVIYSREHYFGPPHTVQSGETLAQIAARYAVTPAYIARVNGLENTSLLAPGQQLKVVTGPFRAELSRGHREITVFVGSYYAGRFSAGVGRDLPLGEMALEVGEKSGARPYVNRETNEQTVAGDPSNPYGSYWIGLRVPGAAVNPRVGLHSTGGRVEASDTRGCISLSERDVDDLQSILSIGSRFTIHR